MTRARRRLHRLKLAAAAASVLSFGGIAVGLAIPGMSSQAVASAGATPSGSATKASTSASSAGTTTTTAASPAATSSASTATTTAPIVSAQS